MNSMLHAETLQRRLWAGAGWLATIGVGLLVGFVNFYVGIFVVALALVGAALLLTPLRVVPLAGARSRRASAAFAPSVGVQRVVYSADGEPRAAIVVPVDSAEGYAMVLTSEGYKLVDDAGKIVYTLK